MKPIITLRKKSLLLLAILLVGYQTNAAVESIPAGSFIINMGVTPQTVGNGLKPYGMIYDLIKNYDVPVDQVINTAKAKDGVDFTYNGIQYRGGSYIIKAGYITPVVAARITYWIGQGVIGVYTISTFSVDVYVSHSSVPIWILDAQNGSIATNFFTNAGIPASSYQYLNPQLLGACQDVFVMPHADPQWSTHNNLYFWNQTYKGAIWAGCHAVSVLENMTNPANPSQRTNFLTTNGLLPFTQHGNGTPPYLHGDPGNPAFQYMGPTDLAHLNGSEQIYMPKPGSAWRSTTAIGTYDPTQADVPSKSPGVAAVNVWGRAFGDPNRGQICYEGGHRISGGTGPNNIAAMRIFFNWSFMSMQDRKINVSLSGIPSTMTAGSTYSGLTVSASGGGGSFSYQWVSSGGGTFSNPTSATTSFTPSTSGNCAIKCIVTDACSRKSLGANIVNVQAAPAPPVALTDFSSINSSCLTLAGSTTINVLTNDFDTNGDSLTVTGLSNTTGGSWTYTPSGSVTFTPADNFFGMATAQYSVCDPGGLCATGNINIATGTPDSKGCYPGFSWGIASTDSSVSQTNTSVADGNDALNDPDYEDATATSYAEIDNNNDILTLNFGKLITSADSISVFFASGTNASSVTISVSASINGTIFTSLGSASSTQHFDATEALFRSPTGGFQYVRIQRTTGTARVRIDAALANYYSCLSNIPIAQSDIATVKEDLPTVIQITANDQNPLGSALDVSIVTLPTSGMVSVNNDGTITYVSNRDYSGNDSLIYMVCNAPGICSSAKVYITIQDDSCTAGNYRPLNPTIITTTISGAASTDDNQLRRDKATTVYNNDKFEIGNKSSDARRAILRFDVSSVPAGASLVSANLLLTQNGGNANAGISLSVHQLSQSFVETQATWNNRITAGVWTTAGGTYLPSSVFTGNFARLNNGTVDTFRISSLVQQWVNGSVNNGLLIKQTTEGLLDKKITYSSSNNGTSSEHPRLVVSYRVPATCSAIPNRAPLANPDEATTKSVEIVSIPVLINDTDPDAGNTLSVSLVGAISNGSASISGSNIVFTPTASFNGTTRFSYRVCDNNGLCDTSFVKVNVTNSAPISANDSISTLSSTPVTIAVQSNDTDLDGPAPLVTALVKAPNNGSVNVSGINAIYSPAAGFTGIDSFYYSVCETPGGCTLSKCDTSLVKITIINRAPIAVADAYTTNPCQDILFNPTLNDSDPDGGTLTYQLSTAPLNGTASMSTTGITYVPNSGFNGVDTFRYVACDNGNPSLCSAPTLISITVLAIPVNGKPIAVDDVDSTVQNSVLYADVLANDTDPDNHVLDITLSPGLIQPNNGTVALSANNLLAYTPAFFYEGEDSFEYIVCDRVISSGPGCPAAISKCDTAKVIVFIRNNNINEAPWILEDTFVIATSDVILNYPLITNAVDPDNNIDSASHAVLVSTIFGELTLSPKGEFSYRPNSGFFGMDSFTYQICDLGMPILCAKSTVYIKVNASPLPVEMIYIAANAVDNKLIRLDWATALEINNSGFEIQRSTDGLAWDVIGWVDGNDNATVRHDYVYDDNKALGNINYYYRLRQVDHDGAFEYSSIVTAQLSAGESQTDIAVYPNPAISNTTISITTTENYTAIIEFSDMFGHVVNSSSTSLSSGQNRIEMNVSDMAAGMYTVAVINGGERITQKVMVAK